MSVIVIGAGLAGSEAAWQIAEAGFEVTVFEMRPETSTAAHKTGKAAELVCSNSFRGASLSNAVGLLKEELRRLGSLIMSAADTHAVPAGGALAVDRDRFSETVHDRLHRHPRITIQCAEIREIPPFSRRSPVLIATGPLTAPALAQELVGLTGRGQLAFFDAISPIVTGDSIDRTEAFFQSRYDKGSGDDYLNIPFSKEEYYRFVADVEAAEKHVAHGPVEGDLVEALKPFEGCMPIEDMIERGPDTLRFGPFKPVGLRDPRTGHRPYAALQLRRDNQEGTLWSLVGMQTRMKHGEQLRIFRSLPALRDAEFVRLGTVHRNTFLNSPQCLNGTLEFRTREGLFVAGQVTGVEGYVESTAGGMVAGLNVARVLRGEPPVSFPIDTSIGALMHYVSDATRVDFQPMNISFGLMPSYFDYSSVRDKTKRRELTSERALRSLEDFKRTTLGMTGALD